MALDKYVLRLNFNTLIHYCTVFLLGFPVSENRFIFAEAFVDAMAEVFAENVSLRSELSLSELGKPLPHNVTFILDPASLSYLI